MRRNCGPLGTFACLDSKGILDSFDGGLRCSRIVRVSS